MMKKGIPIRYSTLKKLYRINATIKGDFVQSKDECLMKYKEVIDY